jgi:CHRD domain
MPSKTLVAVLAVNTLGIAACGSSGSASSGSASSAASGRPTAIYRVPLSGRTEPVAGATQGRGDAIVAFHGDSVLCWRFAHLHGFTAAANGELHAGAPGHAGRLLMTFLAGPRLHHQGCVSVSPALSKAVMKDPSGYYLNIPSARYPAGAVRAQL